MQIEVLREALRTLLDVVSQWLCFRIFNIRRSAESRAKTLFDPSRGIPCRRCIGVRGACGAGPLPPNNGGRTEKRRKKEAVGGFDCRKPKSEILCFQPLGGFVYVKSP